MGDAGWIPLAERRRRQARVGAVVSVLMVSGMVVTYALLDQPIPYGWVMLLAMGVAIYLPTGRRRSPGRPVVEADRIFRRVAVVKRWITVVPVLWLVALFGLALVFGWDLNDAALPGAATMGALFSAGFAYRFGSWRLLSLIEAEWAEVDVDLEPWAIRGDGTVKAEGTMRRADGVELAISMHSAPAELVGAMWETGVVWVAGEPTPESAVAVGLPGYPLLAVARVS
ncbi:hypothetical protein [Alloactinosynnema sp. L-07]|uniref:hypothetical protein n=1 Tax=Alloactinosynnema sp. L-07 TaxID=1653480 RepID=UPI00065F0067|nr:hypothetical protein [Alloactinosynnema sp. L-07]CRK55654.1 hypothetical protein [Alloactinosynnema sp. L-07]